jgi:hypothetical protein
MITIFFTSRRLPVLDPVSNGSRFTQQYFIERGLPLLSGQKSRNRRQKLPFDLIGHETNSSRYDGRQITAKMQSERIQRAPHPTYL